MDRNKAISIYKQITNLSDETPSFNLKKIDSEKYELRIKKTRLTQIEDMTSLAQKNEVLVREETGELVFYS